MILYHGSNIDIIHIDLSQSKTGKDFGCGFYLSADKEQARELAERKTEQIGITSLMKIACATQVYLYSVSKITVRNGRNSS